MSHPLEPIIAQTRFDECWAEFYYREEKHFLRWTKRKKSFDPFEDGSIIKSSAIKKKAIAFNRGGNVILSLIVDYRDSNLER